MKKYHTLVRDEKQLETEVRNIDKVIRTLFFDLTAMGKELNIEDVQGQFLRLNKRKSKLEEKLYIIKFNKLMLKSKNSRQFQLSKDAYGLQDMLEHLNATYSKNVFNRNSILKFYIEEENGKVYFNEELVGL